MSENEHPNFRMNWPAFWATVIALIAIGWSLGLIVKGQAPESLACPEEDMIEVVPVEEGVIFFCRDYTD